MKARGIGMVLAVATTLTTFYLFLIEVDRQNSNHDGVLILSQWNDTVPRDIGSVEMEKVNYQKEMYSFKDVKVSDEKGNTSVAENLAVKKETTTFTEDDEMLLMEGAKVRPVHDYDRDGPDVLVYLHIQKTGGETFERHLVLDLKVNPPCKCEPYKGSATKIECKCNNKQGLDWMFQRLTVDWPCGEHAGFTELTTCVDDWFIKTEGNVRNRVYHYATTLREPVERFLSEWRMLEIRHVMWLKNDLPCDGRPATSTEIPRCFTSIPWGNVSLEDFMACKSNLAFNRQTRMLANLSLSDCYRLDSKFSRQERDAIMLRSAKNNLANFFRYFSLTEYQVESARLFEHTFQGLQFHIENIVQKNESFALKIESVLKPEQIEQIRSTNALDVELYKFAKELFQRRLKSERIEIETNSG